MKHPLVLLIGCILISSCTKTSNESLIFPYPDNPIDIVLAIPADGDLISGEIVDQDTGFLAGVREELMLPFHQQLIRVSQCARNLSGNTEGPNLLLLSQNEGGFPRQGIRIKNDSSFISYPDLHFVDLVIDEQRLEQGALSIYSHELGHVMMNLILTTFWDRFPNPTSPKQHVSMGVTDYLTAFYEGWGVSFQRLAYDNVKKYTQTFHDNMDLRRGLRMAWHSNMDEYLRVMKVEDNGYLYEKSPVDPAVWDTLNTEQKILFEHTSNQFNIGKIKNAQQLLSCEGFMATLFYQVNSNPGLQNQYQDKKFYRQFLLDDIPEGTEAEDLFTPLENILLKNIAVWKAMDESGDTDPVGISFIKEWVRIFPDDAKEIITSFLLLSRGATVDKSLPALVEKINIGGQMGDIAMFRKYSVLYMTRIQQLINEVIDDPDMLSAAVGPELWITHPTIQVRRALWFPEPKAPLAINLNTAGLSEIAAFIGEEKAGEFIELRRTKGYLSSKDEIILQGFNFD